LPKIPTTTIKLPELKEATTTTLPEIKSCSYNSCQDCTSNSCAWTGNKCEKKTLLTNLINSFNSDYATKEQECIKETSKDEIRIEISFEEPIITHSNLEGYAHIEIKDCLSIGNPGDPLLPVRGVKALIPYGKEIDSYRIEEGKRIKMEGKYKIEPAQQPIPILPLNQLKELGFEMAETGPNPETYSLASYPSSKLLSKARIQEMNGYNIGLFSLSPVEYNPSKDDIYYYDKLTLIISLKDSILKSATMLRGIDTEKIKKYVDNPEAISTYNSIEAQKLNSQQSCPITEYASQSGDPVSDTYNYIIITRSDFKQSFQPLIEDKRQRMSAIAITTDWIYQKYQGIDDAETIRNFIRDAYQNCHTTYILLGGDADGVSIGGDTQEPIIPIRKLFVDFFTTESESNHLLNDLPSDLYYSCLDGNFDSNGNGWYGEPDDGEHGSDIDMLSEVYVGRAPVDSTEEIENFIHKTLSYQETKK